MKCQRLRALVPGSQGCMSSPLIRFATILQLGLACFMATGCAPMQPYFLNEPADLEYYLKTATQIEYPDVEVDRLAETTESTAPLSMGNHDYQFWDLTVEECVSIALQNAKFFVTTGGNAEFRDNVAAQFTSASVEQVGSVYDVAIQQSTTQSTSLQVDGNGNRLLPRGVFRANQIGGVEDALAEFDAQVSAFIDTRSTDRARNSGSGFNLSNPLSQGLDTTQQAAISKRIATGGVATLRQQLIYSRNNQPTVNDLTSVNRQVPSDWTAILEAQVQHPLMRNRGALVNRIPVVLASLNEDLSIADFEIQVRNLVRDVEVAYWNLYVAYRNVSTAVIGRNSAIATAKFAKFNFEKGIGTKQELAQAEEQYYNFRARLSASLAGSNLPTDERRGVYGSERTLRELLGIAATDGRLIRPIEEPSLARMEYDWEESVAQLLYLSPELRKGRTVIKQRELEEVSAKNQLLPEVNLSLLYRWVGVGDTFGPPSRRSVDISESFAGTSALAELTGGGFQEGAVRLEITPPAIGSRRERARVRGAQLRLHQSRAFLQDAERLMVSQLSDAVAKSITHYQLVQTHAMRWQAAEQEVEARLAEFRGGRSPVNVVLQSQLRRADAQIAYYRALGEYNKSLNYVDYLKGTLLPNNSISLAEGPWNEKAYWDALERARERSSGKLKKKGSMQPNAVRQGSVTGAADIKPTSRFEQTIESETPPDSLDQGLDSDQVILRNAATHLELDSFRQPVDVHHQPLESLGSNTREMVQKMGDARQDAVIQTSHSVPVISSGAVAETSEETVENDFGQRVYQQSTISNQQKGQSTRSTNETYPTPVKRKPVQP